MNDTTVDRFQSLVREVKRCRHCPRMCDSARVLGRAAGPLNAKLLFVGEAPGRLGADRTEIPLYGDVTGDNFHKFLDFAGILRSEVFVTNAVLCNPKDDKGNNASPISSEISNCSEYLKRQIDLVDPKIVVSLGATALKALRLVEAHKLELAKSVRSSHLWYGRQLISLYHPGQRALLHRSAANQRSDYQFVAEKLKIALGKKKNQSSGKTRADVVQVADYLIDRVGKLSYFQLHKLVYLSEYIHVRNTGKRLTNAYYIRQKDGPYCTDLEVRKLEKSDFRGDVVKQGNRIWIAKVDQLFNIQNNLSDFEDTDLERTIDEVVSRYAHKNAKNLKTAVYLTAPMRAILRKEQKSAKNLYNQPVDFLM